MGIEQGITYFAEQNDQESGSGSRLPARRRGVRKEGELIVPQETSVESGPDIEINDLIDLLRRPRQAVSQEESDAEIRQRQESVDRYFIRGGVQRIRRFFDEIKRLEKRDPSLKLDLSMLSLSDKHLNGLYLPGANLEGLVFTLSNISGSNLRSARLNFAVAPGAIMLGIDARSTDWSNAIVYDCDVRGGRFIGATFYDVDMQNWIVDETTLFTGARIIGCRTRGIDWSRANTTGAVFRGNID